VAACGYVIGCIPLRYRNDDTGLLRLKIGSAVEKTRILKLWERNGRKQKQNMKKNGGSGDVAWRNGEEMRR